MTYPSTVSGFDLPFNFIVETVNLIRFFSFSYLILDFNSKLSKGTETFLRTVKSLGYKVAIISGGFSYFADALKEKIDFDWRLLYYGLIGTVAGIFVYLFIVKRNSKEETEETRRKNARKKLAQKLAVAKSHLDRNEVSDFYNEIFKIGFDKVSRNDDYFFCLKWF